MPTSENLDPFDPLSYWTISDPGVLQDSLRHRPLTRESIKAFVQKNDFILTHKPMDTGDIAGAEPLRPDVFGINVASGGLSSLAHELIHLLYHCGGYARGSERGRAMETLIETEVARFLQEENNVQFIAKIQ